MPLKSAFSFFKKIIHKRTSNKTNNRDLLYETLTNLRNTAKLMSNEEKSIINNFLKFGSKTVSKVMIPRTDIFAININDNISDINAAIIDKAHTRSVVYEESLDNIIGFVHIKDLFRAVINHGDKVNLRKIIRKPIITPASMKLVDLLAEMQRLHTHIAIVVDEYGYTDGLLTIEDIIEEIVGRIEDEHDRAPIELSSYKLVSPNVFLFNARMDIEDVEGIIGHGLRDGNLNVETIGGLILSKAGYVPQAGAEVQLTDNIMAEVIEATPRILKTLKISVQEQYSEDAQVSDTESER
jgi:CBS domain containing-hemolysin-like protein